MKDCILDFLRIVFIIVVALVLWVVFGFAELLGLFAFDVLPGNPPLEGIEVLLTISFLLIISTQCALWCTGKLGNMVFSEYDDEIVSLTTKEWFYISIFYYFILFIGKGVCDMFLIKVSNPMLMIGCVISVFIANYVTFRLTTEVDTNN